MSHLKIVKSDGVAPQNLRGRGKAAGQVKRIIATEKFCLVGLPPARRTPITSQQ